MGQQVRAEGRTRPAQNSAKPFWKKRSWVQQRPPENLLLFVQAAFQRPAGLCKKLCIFLARLADGGGKIRRKEGDQYHRSTIDSRQQHAKTKKQQ